MLNNTVDFPDILEAFKHDLHVEDASRNTTSCAGYLQYPSVR